MPKNTNSSIENSNSKLWYELNFGERSVVRSIKEIMKPNKKHPWFKNNEIPSNEMTRWYNDKDIIAELGKILVEEGVDPDKILIKRSRTCSMHRKQHKACFPTCSKRIEEASAKSGVSDTDEIIKIAKSNFMKFEPKILAENDSKC